MGPEEVRAFLSHLALNRDVAASTQNQALCALVFLYTHVIRKGPLGVTSPVDRLAEAAPQVTRGGHSRLPPHPPRWKMLLRWVRQAAAVLGVSYLWHGRGG